MKIYLKQANILDIEADVLVCSANVCLNLTGGVGADIVARYGNDMQAELHDLIDCRSPKCAQAGEVFSVYTTGLPYKVVLHAVAVDPFYHSSKKVVEDVVRESLRIAAQHGAVTVALTALASGFGDMTLDGFAEAVKVLLNEDFTPVKKLIIPQIEDYRFEELCEAFGCFATIIEV